MKKMEELEFEIKFDEEFKDYYITPFKDCDDYVWINDIMQDDKGKLVMITEYGFYNVKEIDWQNMKVVCEI